MKGTIKAISTKNNSVLIIEENGAEKWFNLIGGVSATNLKKGTCDYTKQSMPDGNEAINYVNITGGFSGSSRYITGGFSKFQPRDSATQETISRQWAINAAISMLNLKPTVVENLTTLDEIEATVKELAKRLKALTLGGWE